LPAYAAWLGQVPSSLTLCKPAGLAVRVFIFIFFYFFRFIKNIYQFFLQNCHHAAGSFGGKEIPPDEPAVGAVGPRLTAYRRLNWR